MVHYNYATFDFFQRVISYTLFQYLTSDHFVSYPEKEIQQGRWICMFSVYTHFLRLVHSQNRHIEVLVMRYVALFGSATSTTSCRLLCSILYSYLIMQPRHTPRSSWGSFFVMHARIHRVEYQSAGDITATLYKFDSR